MKLIRKPKIAVLLARGTNCHEETAYAIKQAGGIGIIIPIQDLVDQADKLSDYAALVLAGGFADGDHLAAGRITAIRLLALKEELQELLVHNRPILGICNGFQILTETGLLPGRTLGERNLALLQNGSARFESRIVKLLFEGSNCIFTKGLSGRVLSLPVAHAEGRISTAKWLHVVCRYADASGNPTEEYPANPNGSPEAIAGITDETGLIFGLMPHPERTIEKSHPSQDGRLIFQNLITFLTEN